MSDGAAGGGVGRLSVHPEVSPEDVRRLLGVEWNEAQRQAVDVLQSTKKNVLLVAPTGSGKSAVGYCALTLSGGGYYLAPTRALCYEKAEELSRIFGRDNVVIANKDYSATPHLLRSALVRVTTPFKLAQYLTSVPPSGTVVVDEVHNLTPEVETILTEVKRLPGVRVVALSATLSDEDVARMAKWLDAVVVEPQVKRPVPLTVKAIQVTPTIKLDPEPLPVLSTPLGDYLSQEEFIANYTAHLLTEEPDACVLVWAPTRRMCDTLAGLIAEAVINRGVYALGADARILSSSPSDEKLAQTVRAGVGIHHGGVSQANRELVYNLFREKKLRVVATAYTLAQGVNLPARHVVVTTLFETQEKLMDPSTFHQLAGRAGRPGLDPYGAVHVVVQSEAEKAYLEEVILKTKATPLESRIAGDWFLTKMVMHLIYTTKQRGAVLSFFDSTFYAAVRDAEELKTRAAEVVEGLRREGVIQESTGGALGFTSKTWEAAARLFMHPEEARLARDIPFTLSYRAAVENAITYVVKPQGEWRSFDQAAKEAAQFGLLTYYASSSYEARQISDLAQAFFDTAALFNAALHGWRSEQAKAARDVAERFSYADMDVFRELRETLPHSLFKNFVRNFARSVINGTMTPEDIEAAADRIFWNRRGDGKLKEEFRKILLNTLTQPGRRV